MIGLYVHVPFCLRKCNYCDFCSFDNVDEVQRREYLNALIREINSYKREPKIKLATVFFGGGTPSLLSPCEFLEIYDTIRDAFDLSRLSEFTLEANPATLNEEKLCAYKSAGVNRISIGLQSIHENELKKLGRIHNLLNFENSLSLAHKLGFDNLNVDLMYGIPEQTKESFKKTLEYASSLDVQHLSVYGLIVEEKTPFGKMADKLVLPSEDEEADMYDFACRILSDKGFSHYEISNYSKPGFESQHNLIYWSSCEYIGVGLAAHSYFSGERFSNTESFSEYSAQNAEEYKTKEKVSESDAAYEFAMLALRLKEGFSLKEYEAKFKKSFLSGRERSIEQFIRLDLISLDEERIKLTEKGFYVSNTILSTLL